MASFQRRGALLAAALLALLAPLSLAQFPSTRPGLFYIFMSGQIVVVDADTGTTVKSIRTLNDQAAQIPNTCPGGPLQGRWNDVAMGAGGHTIFASFSFAAQGTLRQAGLQDGVAVINATTQEIQAIIPISGLPGAIKAVPEDGSVWVHADSAGTFTLFSISPSYDVAAVDLGKDSNVAAAGALLTDPAMNGKGYMTSASSSGLYVYNLYARTGASFVNFQTFQVAHHSWLPKRGVYCPATRDAVYAPTSRRVFVACARVRAAAGGVVTAGAEPGIVEISTDTDQPVDAWPHIKADKLYLTPDETLVLALDSESATINILQPLPGVNSDQTMSMTWMPIYLRPGTRPDTIVFMPKGKFYIAVVSLLNSRQTAIIDFNVLIPCGSYCPVVTVASAVSYIFSGDQLRPGAPSSAITSRPIAAGHKFVCVDNAVNTTLVCHNMEDTTDMRVFRQMKDIQQIMFVEGPFHGNEKLIPVYTAGRGISTNFAC